MVLAMVIDDAFGHGAKKKRNETRKDYLPILFLSSCVENIKESDLVVNDALLSVRVCNIISTMSTSLNLNVYPR